MDYIRRRFNATALVFTLLFCTVVAVAAEYVGQIPTTKIPGFPVKGVTVGNFGCDYNGNNETPFLNALTAAASATTGQKHITVVNGTFTFSTGVVSALDDIYIECRGGVKFNSAASGSIGLFQFTGDRITLTGLEITTPTVPVNDQIIVDLSTSNFSRISDSTISFAHPSAGASGIGVTTNPMVGFRVDQSYMFTGQRMKVFPSHAVTGFFDKSSLGSRYDQCAYTNKVMNPTPLTPSPPVGGWIGFYGEGTQGVKLNDFFCWGVGTAASDFGFNGDVSTRPKAIVYLKGISGEDGHSIIENLQIESTACVNHVLLEGVYGWTEIINPCIGFAQAGQYKLGESGIRITKNVAANRNCRSVRIRGGTIHNLGNSIAASTTLFQQLRGSIMTGAARVDITDSPSAGTANNFHLNTGSWNLTPNVGEFIKTANQTSAVNNGYYKVVFADANDITVDKTMISAGALTNEVGDGNELITGAAECASAAVWIDNATDVDIDGLAITDQRFPWGIALDTTTVRGIALDNITFHRAKESGSDIGAIAPIRLLTGTLPDVGTGPDLMEGISYGVMKLKNWGATPVLVSNGAWSFTSDFATSAPTITTTNAPYMTTGISNASSNFDQAGAGVATNNLTLTRRMN